MIELHLALRSPAAPISRDGWPGTTSTAPMLTSHDDLRLKPSPEQPDQNPQLAGSVAGRAMRLVRRFRASANVRIVRSFIHDLRLDVYRVSYCSLFVPRKIDNMPGFSRNCLSSTSEFRAFDTTCVEGFLSPMAGSRPREPDGHLHDGTGSRAHHHR